VFPPPVNFMNPLRFSLPLLALGLVCPGALAAAPAAPSPLVRVSVVSQTGMPKNIVAKGADWNFGSGSLWTHRGWQYAAFWDEARRVSVARRQLPDGAWSVVSLPGYERTENINRGEAGPVSRGFGDSHEKVTMGISPDGVIHLAFDHHVSTLHYRASKLPVANDPAAHAWSADLFGPVQDNLGGPAITTVTYPSFTSDGTHFALYLRLNIGSGNADSHFFAYEAGKWTVNTPAASKFIDRRWSGGDKTVNAYPHALVIHQGRRHLTWCWRDTPDAKSCHDLGYAYSDDQGKTWLNNDGQVVARLGQSYLTADSPGIAVWAIPPGTRYINGGSMTVDHEGRVHVLVRGEDGSPAHFQRDPGTRKWTRRKSPVLGDLAVGAGDHLYVVNKDGLYRTSASRFGEMTTLVSGQGGYFQDCQLYLDRSRHAHDGWISVIGQTGKTVTVLDYQIKP
jgi:hypothetical protein